MERSVGMDQTVFDVFVEQDYTFLRVNRGTVKGDIVIEETNSTGVFKLRHGMNAADDQETKSSEATLHIHPNEPFISTGLIGHGIRHDGKEYEIVNITAGRNFDNSIIEHWRLTLQAADFVYQDGSS